MQRRQNDVDVDAVAVGHNACVEFRCSSRLLMIDQMLAVRILLLLCHCSEGGEVGPRSLPALLLKQRHRVYSDGVVVVHVPAGMHKCVTVSMCSEKTSKDGSWHRR